MTSDDDAIQATWPFVWDDDEGLYFRPESGGLLLSPCDEVLASPGDYSHDSEPLELLAEKVNRLQPGIGNMSIKTSWVGQRTFAEDRNFVIGADPREAKFFWVAALGGHGVTCSPAVGRFAANLILNPQANISNPYSPARLI